MSISSRKGSVAHQIEKIFIRLFVHHPLLPANVVGMPMDKNKTASIMNLNTLVSMTRSSISVMRRDWVVFIAMG